MDFQAALEDFLAEAQEIVDADWHSHGYTHAKPPRLVIGDGRKYIRIEKRDDDGNGSKSVYCFIVTEDTTTKALGPVKKGDIMKAESWRKPARHARSNIFSPDHGVSGITWHGGRYLG